MIDVYFNFSEDKIQKTNGSILDLYLTVHEILRKFMKTHSHVKIHIIPP